MLAYVLDSVFAPELKPMEPGYPEFPRDMTEELRFHCQSGSCSKTHFGWGSESARANFVVKCAVVQGRYLGCDHFKQMWGDTKVYPAGSSAFVMVSGKLEMVVYELRGDNGEKLALRQGSREAYAAVPVLERSLAPVVALPQEPLPTRLDPPVEVAPVLPKPVSRPVVVKHMVPPPARIRPPVTPKVTEASVANAVFIKNKSVKTKPVKKEAVTKPQKPKTKTNPKPKTKTNPPRNPLPKSSDEKVRVA